MESDAVAPHSKIRCPLLGRGEAEEAQLVGPRKFDYLGGEGNGGFGLPGGEIARALDF